MSDFYLCLKCETKYPLDASVCPQCGSDRRTRWLDEPEHREPVYHAPVRRRTARGGRARRIRFSWNWVVPVVALLLIVALVRYMPGIQQLGFNTILMGIAVLIGIVYLITRARGSGTIMPESYLYNTLLRRTRGDAGLAARLIEYERRRDPNAGRAQHIREAIDRLDRDRGW